MTVISAPQPAPQPAQAAPGTVEHPALAALVARSAHKMDPVRWAYLQALAQRTAQQHSELREHLQGRLALTEQGAVLDDKPIPATGIQYSRGLW